MQIHRSRKPGGVRPGDVAFVVHLTVATESEQRGRVEHLASGRALQFTSAGELLGFMRDTLAGLESDVGEVLRGYGGP